jgi:hypothetical protein
MERGEGMMLKFLVKGQKIEILEREVIASDQIAFVTLKFVFDGDWKKFHKVVQFTQCDETYNRVLCTDGLSCLLPAELHAGAVKLSVFGYDADNTSGLRATTVPVTLHIRASGFVGEDADSPIPPTPDLYTQLLQKIGEVQHGKDGADGKDGKDGLSAYELAVENGFTGTLAEWLASLKGKDGENGVDGKNGVNHEAIIEPSVYDLVQVELAKRSKKNEARYSGVSIFSNKIKCAECGSWYGSKVWHSNDKYRRVIYRCNHKFDENRKCETPHVTEEEIIAAFIKAMNILITERDEIIENIQLIRQTVCNVTTLEQEQDKLRSEMEIVVELTQSCVAENARTAQNQEDYQKRYDGLVERYEKVKSRYDAIVRVGKQPVFTTNDKRIRFFKPCCVNFILRHTFKTIFN